MKIHLEELQHQRSALDAILAYFPKVISQAGNICANPILEKAGDENFFIDIKMETGTGKTYVYTRAMYELHQKYGIFKFIIVVPSLAIKEGTKNFITSDYARQHFSCFFPNKRIELQTVNAGDFVNKKGKRKNIPAALTQFCEATKNEKNTIQCLLLSDKGFLDRNDSALFKDDYDQTLFGGYASPVEGVKNTLPVLFIDEPHRLRRDGSTYKNIMGRIHPQLIVRFGATFPEIKIGKGRNAVFKKDFYQNKPQFDLGAVDAFNQDLVKGVSVRYPDLPENSVQKYKVKKATKTELVLTKDRKEWILKNGEDLSVLGEGFEGNVTYESGKLSTDLTLSEGMELVAGVFSNSYQELLLRQALDAHFETEINNFHRSGYKVKTNALFFIDSIKSYRDKDGWLKNTFEKLLKAKLDALLDKYPVGEYHDFLTATKKNLSLAHGGYFAKDWGEADDSAISEEREDILHKERTLPFKKPDGTWNIRRFFFSKWTLREGWDNPNVFTICKLRSSGSESNKIQEVGRGLRLPVDERGNRLAHTEWYLTYLVGWDEKDFAEKLIGQINSDAKTVLNREQLTEGMIKRICTARNITEEELLSRLDQAGVITRSNKFQEGGCEKLISLYPELLQEEIKSGKIISPAGKTGQRKMKLKINNWRKIEDFWKKVSRRYMLYFERIPVHQLAQTVRNTLRTAGVFDANQTIRVFSLNTQKSDGGRLRLAEEVFSAENTNSIGKMPYCIFVENASKRTDIPVQIIHKELWGFLKERAEKGMDKNTINAVLNQNSLERFVSAWREKFAEMFATKYDYDGLNFTAETSVLKDGDFIREIAAGLVGSFSADDILPDDRNLYEKPLAYDSEDPEHKILKITPPAAITVFGKVPRRAIKVPIYTGGSTSPDFVYAAEIGERKHLYILIESKSSNKRETEKRALSAQHILFAKFPDIHWHVIKQADEVLRLLAEL